MSDGPKKIHSGNRQHASGGTALSPLQHASAVKDHEVGLTLRHLRVEMNALRDAQDQIEDLTAEIVRLQVSLSLPSVRCRVASQSHTHTRTHTRARAHTHTHTQRALAGAEVRVAATEHERDALDRRVEELEAQNAAGVSREHHAARALARAERRAEKLSKKVTHAKASLAASLNADETETLAAEVEHLRIQVASYRATENDAAAFIAQISGLRAREKEAAAELDARAARVADLQGQVEALTAELTAAVLENERLSEAAADLHGTLNASLAEITDVNGVAEAAGAERDALQASLAEALQRAHAAEVAVEEVALQNAALVRERDAAAATLAARSDEFDVGAAVVAGLKARVAELEAVVEEQRRERWVMEEDLSGLRLINAEQIEAIADLRLRLAAAATPSAGHGNGVGHRRHRHRGYDHDNGRDHDHHGADHDHHNHHHDHHHDYQHQREGQRKQRREDRYESAAHPGAQPDTPNTAWTRFLAEGRATAETQESPAVGGRGFAISNAVPGRRGRDSAVEATDSFLLRTSFGMDDGFDLLDGISGASRGKHTPARHYHHHQRRRQRSPTPPTTTLSSSTASVTSPSSSRNAEAADNFVERYTSPLQPPQSVGRERDSRAGEGDERAVEAGAALHHMRASALEARQAAAQQAADTRRLELELQAAKMRILALERDPAAMMAGVRTGGAGRAAERAEQVAAVDARHAQLLAALRDDLRASEQRNAALVARLDSGGAAGDGVVEGGSGGGGGDGDGDSGGGGGDGGVVDAGTHRPLNVSDLGGTV